MRRGHVPDTAPEVGRTSGVRHTGCPGKALVGGAIAAVEAKVTAGGRARDHCSDLYLTVGSLLRLIDSRCECDAHGEFPGMQPVDLCAHMHRSRRREAELNRPLTAARRGVMSFPAVMDGQGGGSHRNDKRQGRDDPGR